MNGGSTRTIVFGFDALTFEYVDEFDLPAFDSLRERGVEAPLRSTHPPWTASAWPSMYTGVDPSRHGVYDFFRYDEEYPDKADIVTRSDVRTPALWNYLSSRELSSIVLNMPVTYPADRIDGVEVPGYLAPENAPGYPEGIRAQLDDAVGGYRIYSRGELSADGAEKLRGYTELIDIRRRAAEYLLTNYDWRLGIVQVQKTDAVFHNFEERGAHRRVYEAADDLLGSVLETIDEPVNVVVCSDHGIGPVNGYRIYLNEILRRDGLVETTNEDRGPSLDGRKARLAGDIGDGDAAASAVPMGAVSMIARALQCVGVTPADIYTTARRFGVAEALLDALPAETNRALGRYVDWSASAAYCRSRNELGVRINLEGREPDGVVSPERYERTRDRVIDRLDSIETPDGRPAFEWVKRREAVYDGPYADDACDVLFMPTGMGNAIETKLLGRRFVEATGYDHKPDGAFVAAGPDVAGEGALEGLSLTDIAPIVMGLVEGAVPARMTGSVPNSLLSKPVERQTYNGITVDTGADEADDDGDLERRLEDLGYI